MPAARSCQLRSKMADPGSPVSTTSSKNRPASGRRPQESSRANARLSFVERQSHSVRRLHRSVPASLPSLHYLPDAVHLDYLSRFAIDLYGSLLTFGGDVVSFGIRCVALFDYQAARLVTHKYVSSYCLVGDPVVVSVNVTVDFSSLVIVNPSVDVTVAIGVNEASERSRIRVPKKPAGYLLPLDAANTEVGQFS